MTEWFTQRPEEMGRDERKMWLSVQPAVNREDWWLWKPCLPTGGEGGHLRLNDVAEAMAHRLGSSIGLPTAECELALRAGVRGVISRNVSPHPMDLQHGSQIVYPGMAYGLASIASALHDVASPAPCEEMTGFQVFAGYLVLDAWIANTDRHGENWAVLQAPDGTLTLAPAFDHGSALGSGLTDPNRARRRVEDFCSQGKTRHFAEGGTLLDIARAGAEMSGASWWAERAAQVPPDNWRGILSDIEGLSVVARTFIDKVLTRNQERVSTLCRR